MESFEGPRPAVRARLAVSAAAAESEVGQHLAWMGANLLARLYGVINAIEIVAPRSALARGIALFGEGDDLLSTLTKTASEVAGPGVTLESDVRPGRRPALVLAVGADAPIGTADDLVVAAAHGWSCVAYRPPARPPAGGATLAAFSHGDRGRNPFGAYLAACIGVGEIFKRALGLRPGKGRYLDALALSAWDWSTGEESLVERLWLPNAPVGNAYLIGVGAVGQAALAALFAAEVCGCLVTIDEDVIDETNLNRYPLATLKDLRSAKVELASARAQGRPLTGVPQHVDTRVGRKGA